MRQRPRALLVCACLLAAAIAPPAAAQSSVELAREAEASAREAYQRGDYQRAAAGFAEAHRVSPSAATKYNEAQAWYKARREAEAADAYDEALRMGTLDVASSDNSRARLAELERKLGVLVVEHPPGAVVRVAHARERAVPARIHLPAGEHAVAIRNPSGREHQEAVRIAAGRATRLSIAEEAAPAPSMKRDGSNPSTAPGPPASPAPSTPRPIEPSSGATQRAIGWSCIAFGGAATAVAIVLGVRAHEAIADFEASGNQDVDLRDDAVALRTWTNVAAGFAVTGVGAGAVLLITAPRNEPRAAGLRVRVGWASAGISTWW